MENNDYLLLVVSFGFGDIVLFPKSIKFKFFFELGVLLHEVTNHEVGVEERVTRCICCGVNQTEMKLIVVPLLNIGILPWWKALCQHHLYILLDIDCYIRLFLVSCSIPWSYMCWNLNLVSIILFLLLLLWSICFVTETVSHEIRLIKFWVWGIVHFDLLAIINHFISLLAITCVSHISKFLF